MTTLLASTLAISDDAKRAIYVDFSSDLEANEVLSGTPVVTQVSGATCTLANKQLNAAAYLNKFGETVAINCAVIFSLTPTSPPGTGTVIVNVQIDSNGGGQGGIVQHFDYNVQVDFE